MLKWGALGRGLTLIEMQEALRLAVSPQLGHVRRVLLIPPDISRVHSRAGILTRILYKLFSDAGAEVDLLPALGSHMPMTADELDKMFEGIPHERFFVHDWRRDVLTLGEISSDFVREISGGRVDFSIKIQLNRRLVSNNYDAMIAVGQVVPHEVAGLSSFSKHIFVGCGGAAMISLTHFLGASIGAENIMGRKNNPVRAVFDRAQREVADKLPLQYLMTVVGSTAGEHQVNGLYYGREDAFGEAAKLSAQLNIDRVEKPIQKCIVYLDPEEYRSTWIGNKSIYRTRMALAPEAELLVLAPGVRLFGEDADNDRLIRKYGYKGREYVLRCVRDNEDLAENLSVAAHLIHGSSDGKFHVVYAVDPVNMPLEDIEAVGFRVTHYDDAIRRYNVLELKQGFQIVEGEEIFFVQNPGLGLWSQ